jgi:hypothetical protein
VAGAAARGGGGGGGGSADSFDTRMLAGPVAAFPWLLGGRVVAGEVVMTWKVAACGGVTVRGARGDMQLYRRVCARERGFLHNAAWLCWTLG